MLGEVVGDARPPVEPAQTPDIVIACERSRNEESSSSPVAPAEPVPLRPRKTLYYLRSLVALFALAEPASLLRFLAGGGRGGRLVLRDGTTLQLGGLLVLILKETIVDDSYRLLELDGTAPATIVNVGASVGDFAVWAARRFPSATVVACEPNPASFQLLEENVHANGLTNVAAHRLHSARGSCEPRLHRSEYRPL